MNAHMVSLDLGGIILEYNSSIIPPRLDYNQLLERAHCPTNILYYTDHGHDNCD